MPNVILYRRYIPFQPIRSSALYNYLPGNLLQDAYARCQSAELNHRSDVCLQVQLCNACRDDGHIFISNVKEDASQFFREIFFTIPSSIEALRGPMDC
jgi:hypothetical protein